MSFDGYNAGPNDELGNTGGAVIRLRQWGYILKGDVCEADSTALVVMSFILISRICIICCYICSFNRSV